MSLPLDLQRRIQRAARLLAVLAISVTSSCRLIGAAVEAPAKATSAMLGAGKPAERMPPNLVQLGVMRYADGFAARIAQATQEFAARAGTPQARIQALSWMVSQSTAAFTIASGGNANICLLDMLVLTSLGRMVHEDYWLPKVWGEADRPMLDAYVALESDIWRLAGEVLSPAQQAQVRQTLSEWRASNPDLAATAFVRLPAFDELLHAQRAKHAGMFEDVAGLLTLDPLSGLEPAMREVEQTRLFAERTMFYVQRAPVLLSAQVELLALKLAEQQAVRGALDDTERISQAAARMAETAASLPEAVRAEREAAITQISAELTAQRQGLLADLERAQAPTQQLLVDARATLEAGAQMSTALQGAITSLDQFIAGFRKPDEPPGAAPAPEAQPGKPFDINDYGATAARIGEAAQELNGLVATLDQSVPELQRLIDEAAARGEGTIDHAFGRSLLLGLLLITAAAFAVFAVRRVSSG